MHTVTEGIQGLQVGLTSVQEELHNTKMELHAVKGQLPSVVVGHKITPSTASREPKAMATILDALSLDAFPTEKELPDMRVSTGWKFDFKWGKSAGEDKKADEALEKTSYQPVLKHLKDWGFHAADVGDGARLSSTSKFLFQQDVFTLRQQDPRKHRGQRVFNRHLVEGRSDLAILSSDPGEKQLLRHMVDFVIEVKTVQGYSQSKTGCIHEAQVQLIGLNAANHERSPPVVLTNLAETHFVLHLDLQTHAPLKYVIYQQKCKSFPQAVHLAKKLAARPCVSADFSRGPSRPASSDEDSDA
jgi:hypothetical protein